MQKLYSEGKFTAVFQQNASWFLVRCWVGQNQRGSGLGPPAIPGSLPPDVAPADSTRPAETFFSFHSEALFKNCVFFRVFQASNV